MKTKQLTFLLALTFLFLFSGSVYGGDKDCVSSIRHIEKMMSPSQIEKAQEMARNWKPKKK